jgi:hypothetical protein
MMDTEMNMVNVSNVYKRIVDSVMPIFVPTVLQDTYSLEENVPQNVLITVTNAQRLQHVTNVNQLTSWNQSTKPVLNVLKNSQIVLHVHKTNV